MGLDYNSNTTNARNDFFIKLTVMCSSAVLVLMIYVASLVGSIYKTHQENIQQINTLMKRAGGISKIVNDGFDAADTLRSLRRKQ